MCTMTLHECTVLYQYAAEEQRRATTDGIGCIQYTPWKAHPKTIGPCMNLSPPSHACMRAAAATAGTLPQRIHCEQGGLNAVLSSFASSKMFPKALQVGEVGWGPPAGEGASGPWGGHLQVRCRQELSSKMFSKALQVGEECGAAWALRSPLALQDISG